VKTKYTKIICVKCLAHSQHSGSGTCHTCIGFETERCQKNTLPSPLLGVESFELLWLEYGAMVLGANHVCTTNSGYAVFLTQNFIFLF
jgi:hypothetical protein